MINPNDFVLIYRMGHLVSVGIAHTLRGFNQDRIGIRRVCEAWHDRIEVDRTNGFGDTYKVKVVTEEEWKAADQKLSDGESSERLKKERIQQIKEERWIGLQSESEKWYNSLPPEQKELMDVYMWYHTPIAWA